LLWLNAGEPVTDVARTLGRSVTVLLKVCANCLDGEELTMNDRIDTALGQHGEHGKMNAAADQARPIPRFRGTVATKPQRRRARLVADGGSLENC
jgi:hypothetical protein